MLLLVSPTMPRLDTQQSRIRALSSFVEFQNGTNSNQDLACKFDDRIQVAEIRAPVGDNAKLGTNAGSLPQSHGVASLFRKAVEIEIKVGLNVLGTTFRHRRVESCA